jgi:hypothetical protein
MGARTPPAHRRAPSTGTAAAATLHGMRFRKTHRRKPLSGALLDIRTAAWLTRRFLHVAAGEARRTARSWL